ncbi:MAG: adenylyl-sulfate kinase [Chloroflexia bacterium]|nr:adenylyl-sulfate kinase [Chloroflexia bacterium]
MSTVSQSGSILWITGLPSSGKSSLAGELVSLLVERGLTVQMLDSDEQRKGRTGAFEARGGLLRSQRRLARNDVSCTLSGGRRHGELAMTGLLPAALAAGIAAGIPAGS